MTVDDADNGDLDNGDLYEKIQELYTKTRQVDARLPIGQALCGQCSNGLVYRRTSTSDAGESTTYCAVMTKIIPNDVSECTRFCDAQRISMEDLLRLAIIIDPRIGIHDKSYR